MAKSTTYNGLPKAASASGHFYDHNRHVMQGSGLKTGHLAGGVLAGMPMLVSEPEVKTTFDSKYDYDTGDLYESRGYDYTGRYMIDNKTLQENLQGQPIIIRRDNSPDEEWGLFDGAGYDRHEKKYYVAYKRQEQPRGGLTGEVAGKFFLNSRYDDSIKIIKIRGKRLR